MKILIDCDGVLSNFNKGFLSVANRLLSTAYREEDVGSWDLDDLPGVKEASDEIWRELGAPGFIFSLEAYPGAQEGVEALKQLGEVFVVTAPLWMRKRDPSIVHHGQTAPYERMQWIENHFGIPRKRIIFAHAKELVHGTCLIDDKTANVKAWMAENGRRRGTCAFLWAHRYNEIDQGCHPRVTWTNSWERVVETLKALSA